MDADKAREVLRSAYTACNMHETAAALAQSDNVNIHQLAAMHAIATARTDALREAAERLEAQAAAMESPHIVQDATAKAMATATRDCASVILSLIKEPTQ